MGRLSVRKVLIPGELRGVIEDIEDSMVGLLDKENIEVNNKNTGYILAEALMTGRVRKCIFDFIEQDYKEHG